MVGRDVGRQLHLEAGDRPCDPIEDRRVPPAAGLAALDPDELAGPQALGDRGEAHPPPGLGLEVERVGVLGMIAHGLRERGAGGHPLAALSEPLDGLEHQAGEILGVAGDRLRHLASPLLRARAADRGRLKGN